jgi:tryptophan halogenase
MKNITVIGGGTAGMLAALYVQKRLPTSNITVIASDEIGTLGAGEGSTPHFVFILSYLGINIVDFIKKTNSTIKNAIKFVNWGDQPYYHNFYDPMNITEKNYSYHLNDFSEPTIDFAFLYSKLYNVDLNKIFLASSISDSYLSPLNKKISPNNFIDFESHISWALHFDANLVIKHLKEIALNRGIRCINSKVVKIKTNTDEKISNIILEDKTDIGTDFVIDASGFSRVVIGNFYKEKWISHSKHLTVNRCIPFFIEKSQKIEPYTQAIAMKYGWTWKIPLQNRYGCGYVFNNNFINDNQALQEIEDTFGIKNEKNKVFSFDAGYYENVWVKNCLAIGLAANFIEPLEATSIMQTIRTLISFFNNLNNLHEEDESQKINFNNKIKKDMVETMNFIFLHYITNKKDSEFWDFYRQKKNQPETVKKIMQIIKNDIPSFYDSEIRSIQWGYSAYMSILFGNDLIPHHVYKKYDFYRNKKLYFDERITDIETKKQFLLDHRFFLEAL